MYLLTLRDYGGDIGHVPGGALLQGRGGDGLPPVLSLGDGGPLLDVRQRGAGAPRLPLHTVPRH